MDTQKSYKVFSLVMLILIIGSIVSVAIVSIFNVYEYKHEQKLKQEVISSLYEYQNEEIRSDVT